MKKLLAVFAWAVLCFTFCGISHAAGIGGGGGGPAFTYQTAVSSITTVIITVSTSAAGAGPGATQMDTPTVTSRVSVEIQNIDASANLWCLPVSTTPAVNAGRKISAGSSWVIAAQDIFYNTLYSTSAFSITNTSVPVKFWCVSDGAASTKAAVTQLY